MSRRRNANEVVTIYWRDIPAQVNGQRGRERTQILLSERFQRAIDRAKRKAKIVTAQDDVAQWRRDTAACDGDPFAAAADHAAEIEAAYSDELLGKLGFVGGYRADVEDVPVIDAEILAQLEELDEEINNGTVPGDPGSAVDDSEAAPDPANPSDNATTQETP